MEDIKLYCYFIFCFSIQVIVTLYEYEYETTVTPHQSEGQPIALGNICVKITDAGEASSPARDRLARCDDKVCLSGCQAGPVDVVVSKFHPSERTL